MSIHPTKSPASLGYIEPRAPILRIPPENQLSYKVMAIENLLRSVTGNYLLFNRVDSYSDFLAQDLVKFRIESVQKSVTP